MGGFGQPFNPWGMGGSLGMQQMMGQQQMSQQQMMGMMGQRMPISGSTPIHKLPEILNEWGARNIPPKKKKKCVCAYCGRPAKITQEDACKGCGAWEVEFK